METYDNILIYFFVGFLCYFWCCCCGCFPLNMFNKQHFTNTNLLINKNKQIIDEATQLKCKIFTDINNVNKTKQLIFKNNNNSTYNEQLKQFKNILNDNNNKLHNILKEHPHIENDINNITVNKCISI
jgi:hypothetical protein